jgi:hypothetical protein
MALAGIAVPPEPLPAASARSDATFAFDFGTPGTTPVAIQPTAL